MTEFWKAAGAISLPKASASASDTLSHASETTLRRVPNIITFCIPVANDNGHISHRMTDWAVLAVVCSEVMVSLVTENALRLDSVLKQR